MCKPYRSPKAALALATLAWSALVLAQAPASAQADKQLRVADPPPAARVLNPTPVVSQCKPPVTAAKCAELAATAFDLLQKIGQDCPGCFATPTPPEKPQGGIQPQKRPGPKVRPHDQIVDFCAGAVLVGEIYGAKVTCTPPPP